ncbi:MAG: porin family protein [Gemmatimonadaceae bacterium]
MKKMYLRERLRVAIGLSVVLMSASNAAFAQDRDGAFQDVQNGIYLGANFANISNAETVFGSSTVPNYKAENRTGFKGGLYFNFHLGGPVSFQPEALYTQNGVNIKSLTGSNDKVNVQLNYVEIPLLLRYEVGRAHRIHPALLIGGSGAYRIKCVLKTTFEGQNEQQECGKLIDRSSDPFKKFDASLIGAGSLETQIAGRPISVQLRYTYGLIGIAEHATNSPNVRNRAFGLMVGLAQ